MRSVAFALLAGCYHPTPPQGAPCAANGDCPSPLSCQQGVCVSGSAIDAAGGDGPAIDAPGAMVASNGVVPHFPPGSTSVAIDALATFNTDTGEITGAIARAAGEGVIADIDFHHEPSGNAVLGVFSFRRLSIGSAGVVHFKGAAPAVFVVDRPLTIDGKINGSGGCYGNSRTCAGPGGGVGVGATSVQLAGGCGGGGNGAHDPANEGDTGGGGGAGGDNGGAGGDSTQGTAVVGGAAGTGCIAATVEPLVGGSGGGGGGSGGVGGGGGGAFQLTAFDQVTVNGRIWMGGAGGGGGAINSTDAAAGGGGGGGGGILLEAPILTISSSAVIAANGGGGGGGGYQTAAGSDGTDGVATTQVATGGPGAGLGIGARGGDGGALAAAATAGGTGTVNGGGGGGAAGRVYFRATTLSAMGEVSPAAGTGAIHTQ